METDDLAKLMPRMRVLNARAEVDLNRLKEYMATQDEPDLTLSSRSSVVVRTDVRKDAEGFEDIDDFWADEDPSADQNDTEGEDSSLLSEGMLSTGDLSTSALDTSMSGIQGATDESDTEQIQDTMELESPTSIRSAFESEPIKKAPPSITVPKPSKEKDFVTSAGRTSEKEVRHEVTERRREFEEPASPDFGGDFDMSFGEPSSPVRTAKKPSSNSSPPAMALDKPSQRSRDEKIPPKKSSRRDTRDSFGADVGGFDNDNVDSPFSIHDAVLTPLSNASEKNLRLIDPFSENGSSDSPNIRVQLFKSKKDDDAWDGDHITKRPKKEKKAPASKKDFTTPKKKKSRTYKSSPGSEYSFVAEQTDDDGSVMDKSGYATDENDSDYGMDRNYNSSRLNDLSFAEDVLRDIGKDGSSGGLRRSNRKRFKPLAWYKGEHYVYERRQSGVGLVIPTVRTIERVGTKTPQKKPRPQTKPRVASRSKHQKLFPRDQLPKDHKYEDGEWADLWDTSVGAMNKMNVICRAEEIEHRELPGVDGQEPGYAGQSFNLRNGTPSSRWISGRLGLPPGAAKEAESVGDAVQVFFVMGGQPQALEVALGPAQDGFFDPKTATRFVLNPNDEFYIPAKNAYYLKNHSETSTCELHFMILKPDSKAARSAGEDR